MGEIVKFLEGRVTDDRGRRISDLIAMSDHELEVTHDYIQWVFPNRMTSRFNPDAPITDDKTLVEIRASNVAIGNVRAMLMRMYAFFDLTVIPFDNGDYQLEVRQEVQRPRWITPGNHNFLRVTRILSTLSDLHLREDLEAFLDILDVLGRRFHGIIGERTILRWLEFSDHLDGSS